ncbi:MAG: response regulator [Planctomycetales bacterium]|nr:response regulator [Planctomycetales bacterium]
MLRAKQYDSIHILLVDDDEGDALLAQLAIEQVDYPIQLSHVLDGVEAIAFLNRQSPYLDVQTPDLILLDLNMPRMGGHETLVAIKSDPRFATIPVVVMTTSNAARDISRSYDANANCYISKPMELSDFMDTIVSLADFWCRGTTQFPTNGNFSAPNSGTEANATI